MVDGTTGTALLNAATIIGMDSKKDGDRLSAGERSELQSTLSRLRAELEERTASLPVHSVRPNQIMEIEELEEQIAEIEGKLGASGPHK